MMLGSGCQQARVERGPELVLKIPVGLFRDTERWQVFVSRASHLELIVTSREGEVWRGAYPVASWSTLKIPERIFAHKGEGPYRFEVNFWDRKKNGYLRETPALLGSREVQENDWESETQVFTIRMSLCVPLEEYQKI